MYPHATNQRLEPGQNDSANNTERWRLVQQIILSNAVDPEVLQFIFGERNSEPDAVRANCRSPLLRLFTEVPEQGQRPISRCQEQTPDSTLLQSRDVADSFLDLSFLCEEAFLRYGSEFPTGIWNCCAKACFASMAMGEHLRFFAPVRRIKTDVEQARQKIRDCESFLSRDTNDTLQEGSGEPRTKSRFQAVYLALLSKYLPVLLGKKSIDGIQGKLCVIACRDVLGVSLDTIYRRRVDATAGSSTLIDASDSRQRMLRRDRDRTGLTPFERIQQFICHCSTPCLSEANSGSLCAIYLKFSAISDKPKPYEHENEFIIDLMYDSFMNTDSSYCDKALAEVLGVCSRRIMRARKVVKYLIENPSLLLKEKIAPPHGIRNYASEHHPMNRTSVELRRAIVQGLDIALRADPAASDGRVSFRFYDPNVNTYEKIKELLHKSMEGSLGESIGELSSTTFRRIFAEYLVERDGSVSFSTADDNCCHHCQELELRVSALEMELKILDRQNPSDPEIIAQKLQLIEEGKKAYDIHVGWDHMVRGHLKKLIAALKSLEDDELEQRLSSSSNYSIDECPQWRHSFERAFTESSSHANTTRRYDQAKHTIILSRLSC